MHSRPRSVTLVLRYVDDIKNGVAPLRLSPPSAEAGLPRAFAIEPPASRGPGVGRILVASGSPSPGGHLQWTDGMLYPVLHRLERNGLVAARWGSSEHGRRRRYYRLTKEGRTQLEAERERWKVVDQTLHHVWMEACHV